MLGAFVAVLVVVSGPVRPWWRCSVSRKVMQKRIILFGLLFLVSCSLCCLIFFCRSFSCLHLRYFATRCPHVSTTRLLIIGPSDLTWNWTAILPCNFPPIHPPIHPHIHQQTHSFSHLSLLDFFDTKLHCMLFLLSSRLDFESAVTALNDEFKGSFRRSFPWHRALTNGSDVKYIFPWCPTIHPSLHPSTYWFNCS